MQEISFRLCSRACDTRIAWGVWFVVLPALLFGTLSVLAPLRLAQLGFGSVAIGATWLVAGGLEPVNNLGLGRLADRFGPLAPIRVALVASTLVAIALPWPDHRFVLAAVVVCAGLAFGTFYTPGMTLLTHAAEERGLDYGYAFALVNLRFVDQLDTLGFEEHQQLIDFLGVGVVVRQVVVDLAVCEIAFLLARFEQGFQAIQAVVDLFHQTLPRLMT